MTNTPPLTEPIAVGKTAEIYYWDDGHVLKLYFDGLPIEYVQHEAAITTAVREAGLAVPQTGDVIEVNGRFGLMMQQIKGISLLEAWLHEPNQVEGIAELLASLHRQVHALPALELDILPQQRAWVLNSIQDSAGLAPEVKTEALKQLNSLADGQVLCHGDFHPGNILFTAAGEPVMIDWFSAVVGHPLGDIAQTTLILTAAPLPEPVNGILTPAIRQAASDAYTKFVLAEQSEALIDLQKWQQIVTAAAHDLFGA